MAYITILMSGVYICFNILDGVDYLQGGIAIDFTGSTDMTGSSLFFILLNLQVLEYKFVTETIVKLEFILGGTCTIAKPLL